MEQPVWRPPFFGTVSNNPESPGNSSGLWFLDSVLGTSFTSPKHRRFWLSFSIASLLLSSLRHSGSLSFALLPEPSSPGRTPKYPPPPLLFLAFPSFFRVDTSFAARISSGIRSFFDFPIYLHTPLPFPPGRRAAASCVTTWFQCP